MTSIEQDPENQAEEFVPESPEQPEEHRVESSVDPLEVEADPADVAEQEAEVPFTEPSTVEQQEDDEDADEATLDEA